MATRETVLKDIRTGEFTSVRIVKTPSDQLPEDFAQTLKDIRLASMMAPNDLVISSWDEFAVVRANDPELLLQFMEDETLASKLDCLDFEMPKRALEFY